MLLLDVEEGPAKKGSSCSDTSVSPSEGCDLDADDEEEEEENDDIEEEEDDDDNDEEEEDDDEDG